MRSLWLWQDWCDCRGWVWLITCQSNKCFRLSWAKAHPTHRRCITRHLSKQIVLYICLRSSTPSFPRHGKRVTLQLSRRQSLPQVRGRQHLLHSPVRHLLLQRKMRSIKIPSKIHRSQLQSCHLLCLRSPEPYRCPFIFPFPLCVPLCNVFPSYSE